MKYKINRLTKRVENYSGFNGKVIPLINIRYYLSKNKKKDGRKLLMNYELLMNYCRPVFLLYTFLQTDIFVLYSNV